MKQPQGRRKQLRYVVDCEEPVVAERGKNAIDELYWALLVGFTLCRYIPVPSSVQVRLDASGTRTITYKEGRLSGNYGRAHELSRFIRATLDTMEELRVLANSRGMPLA